jgi:hypothetical protein
MNTKRFTLLLLVGVFLLSVPTSGASKHEWQEGTVVDITSDAPGVTAPGLETAYGYHITRSYYWIKVGDITYVLVNSWSVGFHSPKPPLNVTLNGKIKIAIEGKNVIILDDAGKEIKRPLVTKIAPTENQGGGQQPKATTVALGSDTTQTEQSQAASAPETAKVHITSSPTHGEIYVDGKFFGNAPSDITLPVGQHIVKITIGGKEWSRSIEITPGEITVHADLTGQ